MYLVFSSFQIFLKSPSPASSLLVGSSTLVPSGRMTFDGGDIKNDRGRPRHCRLIRTRYVVYPTLPDSLLFAFIASWMEDPISWPSSRIPSQMPAIQKWSAVKHAIEI